MICFSVTDESLPLLLVTPDRGNTLVAISDKRTTRSEIVGTLYCWESGRELAMWAVEIFFSELLELFADVFYPLEAAIVLVDSTSNISFSF